MMKQKTKKARDKMNVRVIKCEDDNFWYSKNIGDVFSVVDYGTSDYILKDCSGIILKADCEILVDSSVEISCKTCKHSKFTSRCYGCMEDKKHWQPKGTKDFSMEKFVKITDESTIGMPKEDKNLVVGMPLNQILSIARREANLKEAKEKPKKLKYECTACVGTKCIKKTIGVLPTNCKYPQANWKLKEVK